MHPVEDADCKGFSALGTETIVVSGLRGLEPDLAFAVTVQVVFALFGEEFNGSHKPPAGGHGLDHLGIIKPCVKDIGLPSCFPRGVGIGV